MPDITWGNWCNTAITLDQAWNGTLTLDNIGGATGNYCGTLAQVSGMGCVASVERYVGTTMVGNPFAVPAGWYDDYPEAVTDVAEAYIDALNAETADEQLLQPLAGEIVVYRYQITTPAGAQALYQCTGRWRLTMPPSSPWNQFGPTSMTATYSFWLENVVLKDRSGTSNPPGRQVRTIEDIHVQSAWFGAAGATNSGGQLATPVGTVRGSGAWGSHPGVGQFAAGWGSTCQLAYELRAEAANSDIGVVYASIAPKWQGVDLDLQALDDCYTGASWEHWYSGGSAQSPWPPVGTVWRVDGMALSRYAATASDADWTGDSAVPLTIKLTAECGQVNADYPDFSPAMKLDAGLVDTDGDPVYPTNGSTQWYTETDHSWLEENHFDNPVQVSVEQTWMEAAGEYVARTAQIADLPPQMITDRPVGIMWWPLTETDRGDDPRRSASGYLDVTHSSVSVDDLVWVGSGGLTVTGPGTCEIAAGATAPKLRAVIASRYWTQMDRLQSRSADSSLAFKPDWPIYLKANIDTDVGGAIPVDDPLFGDLTATENVYNWDNHGILSLVLAGPRAGTFTVALTYNELESVSDPCYTSWSDRFGPDGQWEYTKSEDRTATYDNDYQGNAIDGTGTWFIDLRCPAEGDLSRGALQHVAAVEITGWPVPASGTDTWTFSEAPALRGVTVNSGWTLDAIRAWYWPEDFFSVAGTHEGQDVLGIQYGYEDQERAERGLKAQQFVQHAPGSSATSDPTYCKSLSRLADELNWQEGFTATFSAAKHADRWRDGYNTYLWPAGEAYWWWLVDEADEDTPWQVAPLVRSVTLERGVPTNLHVRHYLRGRIHGLAKASGGAIRARSEASVATVYRVAAADPDTRILVGSYDSDADGRWLSDPVPELDSTYVVETDDGEGGGLEVVNRELTLAPVNVGDEGGGLEMYQDPTGVQWQAWKEGDAIKCNSLQSGYSTWGTAITVTASAANYDSVSISGDGRVLYIGARHRNTNKPYSWYSLDQGATWTGPTLSG